jgi:hypothetical protein
MHGHVNVKLDNFTVHLFFQNSLNLNAVRKPIAKLYIYIYIYIYI